MKFLPSPFRFNWKTSKHEKQSKDFHTREVVSKGN